jgi:hypothetical protein
MIGKTKRKPAKRDDSDKPDNSGLARLLRKRRYIAEIKALDAEGAEIDRKRRNELRKTGHPMPQDN